MRVCRHLLLMLTLVTTARAGEATQGSILRVGAAAVDITPAPGTPMAGYYHYRAVEGVRDRLYAKAIVVQFEASMIALVALDLSGTTRPVVEQARELIGIQTGIPPDRVLISATHTHTGPQLPRGSLLDEITRANAPQGVDYVRALPLRIAEAVSQAKGALAPASVSAVMGQVEGISFNRRVLREGSSQAIWQPRTIDQTKERPAGPIDPDLGLLVFERTESDASPIATYTNFAMHPTSVGGGQQVSADYPGVLTRLLSERHGSQMVALFANGCCGNINHTDYISGRRRTTEQLGKALADVADKVWPKRERLTPLAPRSRSTMVTLERRRFTAAEIDKAKDIARRMTTESLGTVPMAEAVCILETVDKRDIPLEAEVQVIALSDELAIVGLPGEIFVELGLSIKKTSPFRYTFIAELANGSIGYIPHREAYPQGNYEVVSARGAAGSGEKIVESAMNLLRELKTIP